jgi:hypothetical protein
MQGVIFILTTTLILSFATTYGQDKTKLINEIRKEFKVINSDTTFRKIVLENEEFLEHMPDGGGQLTGFYKAGQLKKIVSWIGISRGNDISEFYFKNEKLIFVYEQFNSFVYDKKKQIFRLDTTQKTFEGHYYFYNNKLIDHITAGYNRFENMRIDAEKTLLKEADDYKRLLEQRIKNK